MFGRYQAVLADDTSILREGNYWDKNSPMLILPYSDTPLSELQAKHKKLSIMVIFEDDGVNEDTILPVEEMVATESDDDEGLLKLERCMQAFSAREQLGKTDTW